MIGVFMGLGGLDSGGAIPLAGCQRAHGAGGPQIEQFGQLDAAFGDRRAGDAVAFGDFGHGGAGVGKAADQGDALGGEAGVVVAEHLAQHPPQGVPDGFGVAAVAAVRFRLGFRQHCGSSPSRISGLSAASPLADPLPWWATSGPPSPWASSLRRSSAGKDSNPRPVFAFVFGVAWPSAAWCSRRSSWPHLPSCRTRGGFRD